MTTPIHECKPIAAMLKTKEPRMYTSSFVRYVRCGKLVVGDHHEGQRRDDGQLIVRSRRLSGCVAPGPGSVGLLGIRPEQQLYDVRWSR